MIYLIFGEQEMMVNKYVEKIAKESLKELDDFNFVVFDATRTPLYSIINDAQTIPFISEKKAVVVNNCYFLTATNPKLDFEQSFEELEEYLLNPVEETLLFFCVNSSKLDERKNLVKKLKKIAKVSAIESISKNDLPRVVKQMFTKEKVEISDRAIEEFIKRVGDDLTLISSEVCKLKLYSSKIDLKDVELLISKQIEDNVFDMIDYIVKGKVDKVFEIYYDLKLMGGEPVTLIALIASQIRFLYQVKVLYNKGFNQYNIANELSANPYRVKFSLEKIDYIDKSDLERMLLELSDLDFKIKSGQIDRFLGFELFLVKACK